MNVHRSDSQRCQARDELPPGLVHPASRPRGAPRGPDGVAVAPGLQLRPGRVHEACGPARRLFAAWVMAGIARGLAPYGGAGATLWIRPARGDGRLNPHGLAEWADPGRLVVVDCVQTQDLLWCAEEALRAGAAALVVVELPEPPALTPVRRLHLAAETGAARARPAPRAAQGGAQGGATAALAPAPLGLLLTPGAGGAAGVESRWWLAPCPAARRAGAGGETPAPPAATGASGSTEQEDAAKVTGGATGAFEADSAARQASTDAHGTSPAPPRWRLIRLRARTAPVAHWRVRQSGRQSDRQSGRQSGPDRLQADRLPHPPALPGTPAGAETP